MGEHVVDFARDTVTLVERGGAALLHSNLFGIGQKGRRLLGLEAIAEKEPAEEEPEDHKQRDAKQSPRIHPIGESPDVDGDDSNGSDSASGWQPGAVAGSAGSHRGKDDERSSALGEGRPSTGDCASCQSEGQHPA